MQSATKVSSSNRDRVYLITVSAPTEVFLKGTFKVLTNNAEDLLTPRLDKVWETECYKGECPTTSSCHKENPYTKAHFGYTKTINTGQLSSMDDVEKHVKATLSVPENASSHQY